MQGYAANKSRVAVTTDTGTQICTVEPGQALLDALMAGDQPLPVHCGGHGACGHCKIRIVAGPVPPPTPVERRRLSEADITAGVRLGCQVRPSADLMVRLLYRVMPEVWRPLTNDDLPATVPADNTCDSISRRQYGLAIDLGTTHIRATLWDVQVCKRLAGWACLNPHTRFGADILGRLAAATASATIARQMRSLWEQTFRGLASQIKTILGGHADRIGPVMVVGNTAMLTLLAGRDTACLLKPQNWGREIDCRPLDPVALTAAWCLPATATLEIVPPVAGFIGSDLLAAMVAAGLQGGDGGALLIDFGTNSEIVLWDGHCFRVTSAAGGPAFDGCGISCGVPAGPGGIYRLAVGAATGDFVPEVFAGAAPQGLCGSGIVDAIALLRQNGTLNAAGRFQQTAPPEGVALGADLPGIRLRAGDVDAFQRAKAAIGAGVAAVLDAAGVSACNLQRVFVCGAFGRHLDIGHARTVGLVPDLPPARFVTLDNAALAGCEQFLTGNDWPARVAALKHRIVAVDLARSCFFENAFVENLGLRPVRMPKPKADHLAQATPRKGERDARRPD